MQTVVTDTLKRYLTVGALVNIGLYVLYLAITRFPVIPEVAMTIVYLVGIATTFHFNRTWSFRSQNSAIPSFIRYALVYATAYFLQLGLFFVFYKTIGWPHEAVQDLSIIVAAVFIFCCLKLWVFAPK